MGGGRGCGGSQLVKSSSTSTELLAVWRVSKVCMVEVKILYRDEFTVTFLHSSFCYAKSQLWRKLRKAWIACTCMYGSFLRVTVIFE